MAERGAGVAVERPGAARADRRPARCSLLAALIALQLLAVGYAQSLADGAAEAGAIAVGRRARCRRGRSRRPARLGGAADRGRRRAAARRGRAGPAGTAARARRPPRRRDPMPTRGRRAADGAGTPRLVVCAAVGEAGGVAARPRRWRSAVASGEPGEADVRAVAGRSARARRGRRAGRCSPRRGRARSRTHAGASRRSLRGAARGRLCFVTRGRRAVEADGRAAALGELLLDRTRGRPRRRRLRSAPTFADLLAAGGQRAALGPAEGRPRRSDRPLIALLAAELRVERPSPVKVWIPPIGPVGARRALAGLEPGGAERSPGRAARAGAARAAAPGARR